MATTYDIFRKVRRGFQVLFLHRLDEIQIALQEASLEILEMESIRKFLMIKGRKTVSR
jgi:hypothetical protein